MGRVDAVSHAALNAFRRRTGAQAMLRGVKAAVVGQAGRGTLLHPDRERYRRVEAFGCQKKRAKQLSGT
jgi:hypothetical protein